MKEFIGFNNIISSFYKRIKEDKLSHAHLIVGPEGIGKSIIAKIFSLKILGKEIDRQYADIINYRLKGASFKVDEVRSIIEEVNKKPYEGDKKVIIIHSANKLTIQAQNALLKTIEEPPTGVYIIILTESLEMMLDTIKSRCQVYKLAPLSNDEMKEFIQINLNDASDEDKKLCLAFSKGIPGNAIKILKDDKLNKLRQMITEMFLDLCDNNDIVLKYDNKFSEYKDQKEEVLNIIISFIRDILVYIEVRNKDKIINIDKYKDIQILADKLSYKKLFSMLSYVKQARINIRNNSNYAMTMSVMLMEFMEGR